MTSRAGPRYACRVTRRLALAATLALGCGSDGPQAFTSTGVTSVAHTSSSSGSTTSTTSTSTSTTGSGGAEDSAAASSSGAASTFDVAQQPDLDDPTPAGCKGKIDFVFAISALGTMHAEQTALIASLPAFMESIAVDFADFDPHVISINSDGLWHGDLCESPDYCLNKGDCGPAALDYECGAHLDQIGPCDYKLGAGLVFNVGGYAYNKPCNLGGLRYITASTPNPGDAFQCIAQVGISGAEPILGDALAAAVGSDINGPQGCNAGFLRPDALLVVVFISDTEDDEPKVSAKKVRETLIAAKGGDEDAIVALAVVPPVLEGEPVEGCKYSLIPEGQHLIEVIEPLPYHARGDICAPEFSTFFQGAAAGLVRDACNAFIPQ